MLSAIVSRCARPSPLRSSETRPSPARSRACGVARLAGRQCAPALAHGIERHQATQTVPFAPRRPVRRCPGFRRGAVRSETWRGASAGRRGLRAKAGLRPACAERSETARRPGGRPSARRCPLRSRRPVTAAGHRAVAEHHEAIGDAANLFEKVADVDDRDARPLELVDRRGTGSRTSCCVSELVGSSNTITLASMTSARAISTTCWSATESWPTGTSSGKSPRPSCCERLRAHVRRCVSSRTTPKRLRSWPSMTFSTTVRSAARFSS